MQVEIPVSIGELVDKITILEIKHSLIADADQLAAVQQELRLLQQRHSQLSLPPEIVQLTQQLSQVNQQLWHIENYKRSCEQQQEFGPEFVQAARNVYLYNDRRAAIKREINSISGSQIQEVKSHPKYPAV